MNLIDLLLAVSVFVAVSHGWRLGVIRGVFGLLGLVGGGWIALQVIPIVVDSFSLGATWRIIGGLGFVVAVSALGESAGFAVGGAIRKAIGWTPVRVVDSALGSAFRLSSWLVIVWLLTSVFALMPDRGVVHQVRTSEIVSLLDGYAPAAADKATAALRRVMQKAEFPQVFAGLTPEPRNSVAAASSTVLDDTDVQDAYKSVFHIEATADACDERMTGTGFLIAQNRIMTNAHVVAGADQVIVYSVARPDRYQASIVYFDSNLDVAVLAIDDAREPALAFADEAEVGTEAVVPGFTNDGPLSPDVARVSDVLIAGGHDIYGEKRVDREIYVLRSKVAAGDSGAPLVGLDGRVLGVVFAQGTDTKETGYALTAAAVKHAVSAGIRANQAVPAGRCSA